MLLHLLVDLLGDLTMRRCISLIAGCLVLCCGLARPTSLFAGADAHDADRDAIQAILNEQQQAWNRGDIDAFLQGYWHSPEVTFSGSSGTVRGYDGILARYKKTYAERETMGRLEFSALEFHFLGPEAALVLGHWHLTRAKGDIGGVFSLVWQKLPEGWRIIHDHTSAVPGTK
jgi:uncharacterized protein (TIGR02246 family)